MKGTKLLKGTGKQKGVVMGNLTSFPVLASAGLALAGCNTLDVFEAQSRVDPIRIASYATVRDACVEPAFRGDTNGGAINLDCFRFKGETQLAYSQAAKDRGYRNRLASILINESNTVCTREIGDLTAHEAMVNAGLATATTAFSTVGAIVTGQVASNILSGLASTTNATRGHINAEVYRNVMAAAVSKAIRLEREKQRTAIRARNANAVADYSVDQMVEDVNQYHQVCSFYRGLDLVLTAVDRSADQTSDQVLAARLALTSVRASISGLNRRLVDKKLSAEEKAELIEQRKALREHETALIKQHATVLPVAQEPPPGDQPHVPEEPQPTPES